MPRAFEPEPSRPVLALLGTGSLAQAPVAAAGLTSRELRRPARFCPGDLQHLTARDALLVLVSDPQAHARAVAAGPT